MKDNLSPEEKLLNLIKNGTPEINASGVKGSSSFLRFVEELDAWQLAKNSARLERKGRRRERKHGR